MSEILTKPLMGVFKSGKWISIPDVSIIKNGISEITLRGWQSEILDLRKQSKLPHLFINCPTGAGKSKAALAIVTYTEKDSDKLVIISAPQKEIGKGFLSSSGDPQKILDHTWLINPSNQLCENSYRNEDGNIARLLEFIKNPRISDLNERVLVCCHATLSLLFDRLSAYEKTKYLKNIKLCIDESHHSLSQDDTGNGLGKVVNYFLKHYANDLDLVMMTATPFRGDKGSLIPEKYLNQFCRYDLDYGRHFEENCSGLEFTYNAVLHQYGDSYGIVIEQLMDKYLDRGDKVLVQIPPSNKSISNGKFNDLQMVYDAIGEEQTVDGNGVVLINKNDTWIKVIDLVTEKGREDRLDYLRKNPDNINVVIGISMIKEGFDWPPANAGILIGSQGSLNAQIQLMGRMFRAYKNKGKDNGQKPVEISQIFPYVDHEKLDEDETREQINTFMKIVYAALAMELVINPIHIDIPLKVESGESGPRKSVKNFLTENLTDTQYTELLSTVMDEFRDWKATAGEDESNSEKISEIVSRKLTELGVDENHKEVAEFFNKSLQRSAKFQMMAMEGIDVSHIDIDLMADIEDPIDSILMGMSNGLCGASDIKEFQRLMKPVDTLRRCYELKEWVEKNGRFPSKASNNDYEKSFYSFITSMKSARRGKGENNITEEHISVLESIPEWKWDQDLDITLRKCHILKEFVEKTGRFPKSNYKDYSCDESRMAAFVLGMKQAKNGKGCYILTSEMEEVLESIPNWTYEINPDTIFPKILQLEKFVTHNNRWPHFNSVDHEQDMYKFVNSIRDSWNQSKLKKSLKLSDSHRQYISNIFGWEESPKSNKLLKSCSKLISFIHENERMPKSDRTNLEEYKLYNTVTLIRKLKKNGELSYEFIDMFKEIELWSWERIDTVNRCVDIKKFYDTNGRYPSQNSKCRMEKSLYKYMDTIRRAKRGKNNNTITDNHIQILESIPNWKW